MTSVSAGHIILTPTQPVGSGRPQRESNPGPPHQESRALPTELPHPPVSGKRERQRQIFRLADRQKNDNQTDGKKVEREREKDMKTGTESD